MLPDFLKTKEKLKKMIISEMKKAQSRHLGSLANAPVSRMFEGNKSIIVREDGSIADMNPQAITAEFVINLVEIEGMSHEMILDKINTMAKEMAEKQAKLSYEVIGKSAEEVGNVVNADGETFSIDLFFQALEKIDRDFDESGNPSELTCTVNPKLFHSIAKIIKQAKTDPKINKRFKALMERKREEWRVRENNRKLVG